MESAEYWKERFENLERMVVAFTGRSLIDRSLNDQEIKKPKKQLVYLREVDAEFLAALELWLENCPPGPTEYTASEISRTIMKQFDIDNTDLNFIKRGTDWLRKCVSTGHRESNGRKISVCDGVFTTPNGAKMTAVWKLGQKKVRYYRVSGLGQLVEPGICP